MNIHSGEPDPIQLRQEVLKYIRQNGFISYPEFQKLFLKNDVCYQGDLDIVSSKNPNLIFWSGWNQEAIAFLRCMEYDGLITKRPATQMEILLSGGMLRLPVVRGNYEYKTPHWLPVIFVTREKSKI